MMKDVFVKIPEDVASELAALPQQRWQLLFSRFIRMRLETLKELQAITLKSKATDEDVRELADEVSLAITERLVRK